MSGPEHAALLRRNLPTQASAPKFGSIGTADHKFAMRRSAGLRRREASSSPYYTEAGLTTYSFGHGTRRSLRFACGIACFAAFGCTTTPTDLANCGAQLVLFGRNVSLVVSDTTTLGLTLVVDGTVSERTSATGTGPAWQPTPPTSWAVSDSSIAAVSPAGLLKGLKQGTTLVYVQRGSARDSSTVRIRASDATAEAIAAVANGAGHTCALTSAGSAWCWGDLWNGAPGVGQRIPYSRILSPSRVKTAQSFASISAGTDHACALTQGGDVYCWGDNRLGQVASQNPFESTPVKVQLLLPVRAIGAGGDNTCALLRDAAVRCWGASFSINDKYASGSTSNFVSISVGARHVCARTEAKELWCWGDNRYGQLGTGDRTSRATPTRIAESAAVAQVSAGGDFTCMVDELSRAWCWGTGTVGQLGQEDVTVRLSPSPVSTQVRFKSVSAGGGHACGLDIDGLAFCWGGNVYGALGIGPPIKPDPTAADLIFARPMQVASQLKYLSVVASGGATCAIVSPTLRLQCWGANTNGQLGIGQTSWLPGVRYSFRDTPSSVVDLAP